MNENPAAIVLADLENAERELRTASARVDRLRRLVRDLKEQYPAWFPQHHVVTATDSIGITDNIAAETGPRGREAVLSVLSDAAAGKLSTVAIQREMEARGWASDRDPEGAIRASLRRLVKDGRIVKLNEKEGRAFVFALAPSSTEASTEVETSVTTNWTSAATDAPDSEGGDEPDGDHRDRHPAPVAGAD